MKVGLLYSRIRRDEKLLLTELRERDHDIEKVDVRKQRFAVGTPPAALAACDVVLDRCLATSRSTYATTFCESYDVPVVNAAETAEVCADKAKTSVRLDAAGVPTPATTVAFDTESAMAAVEAYGYPCVIKPVVGSWGRLLAKIESASAAEAILEHKQTLGHYEHSVFYVQEYVEKPGRDLRVLTLDGEPVAAMARSSDHWLTNAAKGADVEAYEMPEAVRTLARRASEAVGGGLLGVDLMETGVAPDGESGGSQTESGPRYTVPEVNHTVEFKALNDAVDVDVPATVVDWLEATVEAEAATA